MPDQTNGKALLKVDNLTKHFPILRGVFQRQVGVVHAVDGITFEIKPGETFGLVGESGCGKSTAGRTILQLYRPTAGHVYFDGIDLVTKKVTNYSNSPGQYDEPEGIYPDGGFTLVECDKQNHQGPNHVDLWKLKLDGTGYVERLTFFSDYPGYKASNPVVSDDGKFVAFQMAHSRDSAGVGHGLFVFDLQKAPSQQ